MPGMMDTILDLGLDDATTSGLAAASPGTRPSPGRAANGSRRASARSSASPTSRPIRGPSSASRSRPSSDPGRAIAPGPTGAGRASPTTSGRRVTVQAMVFGNRGPTSATGVLFTRNPATGDAGPLWRRAVRRPGRGRRRRHPRTEPIAVLDDRLPAAAADLRDYADPPRAALRRHVRHRVHDRGRPPVAAPGPGRQAEPAGRAADRRRHGRGPGVPADRGPRPSSGSRAAGRPADDDERPERPRPAAR